MATNDFLPFATAIGADVQSQADFAAASTTQTGFESGIAEPAKVNKVWRQSSFIAAALAAWLAEQGEDVPDDGDLDGLLTKLYNHIQARSWMVAASVNAFGGGEDKTSAENTAAILATIASGARIIQFPDSSYHFTNLSINDNCIEFEGTGTLSTELIPDAVAVDAIKVADSASCQSFGMRNIHVVGNSTSTGGVVLGSASYSAAGCNFNNTYISGFTKIGASGLRLVNAFWVNILENCHFYASYYNIHIPTNGVVTTLLIDDNTKLRSAIKHDFFNEATVVGAVDKITFGHMSMEDSAFAAIKGTSPGTTYLFDDAYFEVNCSDPTATATIDIDSSSSDPYAFAIVQVKSIKIHTTLNGLPDMKLGYVQRSVVSDNDGLNTVVTTAYSEVYFRNNRGNGAGDPLAMYKTLLGSIQAEEYDPATGRIVRYSSNGEYQEGDLTFKDGHIASTQTTSPTVTALAGAGSGSVLAVVSGSTDNKGAINFTPGSGAAAGASFRITFDKPYDVPPQVTPSYGSLDVGAPMLYSTPTENYVDIGFNGTPVAGLKIIRYIVLG